jgi:hypothetical protein
MTTQTPQVASYVQQSNLGNLKSTLGRRIPGKLQIFPVFSIIVFFVFTWALYRMSSQVPSWLGYLSWWNVVTLLIYVLASALFESVTILGFVLLICLLFPARFFKEIFVAQGSAIVVILSLVALLMQHNTSVIYSLELWQLMVCILLFLIALTALVLLIASLLKRFHWLRTFLEALAIRMMVFGYCYTLIGFISLIVVLARIIF